MEVPERRVMGGEAGVGGQVPRCGEGGAVSGVEEDPGCGPDADAGHRGQDLGKRVDIEHPLDFGGDLVALAQQILQAVRESWQDLLGRCCARNHYRLLVQGGQNLLDQAFAQAWGVFGGDLQQFGSSGFTQPGRAAAARSRRGSRSRSRS